jgi:hypothetical protein
MLGILRARARHFLNQLFEHRLGEAVHIFGDETKARRAADDIVGIVLGEPRLLGEDGETVDRDPLRDHLVTHLRRRRPKIGHAIARDVDYLVRGRLRHVVKGGGSGRHRGADRGEPMRGARRRPHRGSERGGAGAVGDPGPADSDRYLVGIGPFEHQHFDPARRVGDRVDQRRCLKGARDTVMLEDVAVGGDALRHIDRQHQRHIRRPHGAGECHRGAAKKGERDPHRVELTPHRRCRP